MSLLLTPPLVMAPPCNISPANVSTGFWKPPAENAAFLSSPTRRPKPCSPTSTCSTTESRPTPPSSFFGANPQRFHRTAETKCIHCHGTEYRRPFASLQVYGGDLFEQADQARDFVLAKINRAIGTRAASITAPATYELPPDAVGEAIVNAIAHRDYHSNASVEVRLFADRLEVWNPGRLPGTLTLDSLRNDHPSVPYNPLIAESLYLTRYIERVGSGTQP